MEQLENNQTLTQETDTLKTFIHVDTELKHFATALNQVFVKDKKPEYAGWFTLGQFNKAIKLKNGKDLLIRLMQFGYLKVGKIDGITKYKVVFDVDKRVELINKDIKSMEESRVSLEENIKTIGQNINLLNDLINYLTPKTEENATDNRGNTEGDRTIETGKE